MLDPAADAGSRVWTSCKKCGYSDPAGAYMLGNTLGEIWCQCGACFHRWFWQSGVGKGGSPDRLDAEGFPA